MTGKDGIEQDFHDVKLELDEGRSRLDHLNESWPNP